MCNDSKKSFNSNLSIIKTCKNPDNTEHSWIWKHFTFNTKKKSLFACEHCEKKIAVDFLRPKNKFICNLKATLHRVVYASGILKLSPFTPLAFGSSPLTLTLNIWYGENLFRLILLSPYLLIKGNSKTEKKGKKQRRTKVKTWKHIQLEFLILTQIEFQTE